VERVSDDKTSSIFPQTTLILWNISSWQNWKICNI